MSGPGFSQHLHQKQTQQMVLAPQLRQSLKILQVAALDLRTVIAEELENNPTLEELPMEGISLDREKAEADSDADNRESGSDTSEEGRSEPLDFSKEFQILGKLDEDWRDHMSSAGGAQQYTSEDAERRQHFFDSLVTETSLQEHLIRQAELSDLDELAMKAMHYLVGSLDDRGFLAQSVSDIALQAGLPLSSAQEALKVLRGFDPPGIGSASLAECLLAQLAAKGRAESLASRIIKHHIDLLTRRRIPEIARKLSVPMDEIQIAIEEIGSLDPAPGRRFAADSNRSVNADVTLEKDDDKWVITLNSDYIPRLRISSTYREMIAKGTLNRQERDYLRERMRSGKFLISSIEQRQQTIERITREIVNVQEDFLEHGVSHLKPLTMTQIADAVGVHETTVSRAIANKYVRTPHGVFELKFFFTPGYQADSGASVSNKSVKEMIADLVSMEDRGSPLSDQEIVTKLQEKGLKVARRTVAKYREELGIMPSNLRRDYK